MLTVASVIGLEGWRILFNNFAVDIVHLDGNYVGFIQSVREIPGFLAFLAIYVMLILKEHKLSAFSIFCLGLGVALTGFFPSFAGLLFTTLLMSFGFHYYETTNQSLSLQYFDKNTSPWIIGKLRSYNGISSVLIAILLFLISGLMSFKQMYLIIGSIVMIIGIWGLIQDPTNKDIIPQKKKMVFKRRYWLFYILTFLSGARRQIFVVFAIFLLVKKFHFSIQEITVLFIINNSINFILSPLIGKAIIKFGERRILSIEYSSAIFIFLTYSYVESKYLVAILYVLDSIFYNFVFAIRTFFQKISKPEDIAPSMAVGFTINHIAAVVIPFLGGLLWVVDYHIPFIIGSFLGLCSLLFVQKIGKFERTELLVENR